MKKIISVLIALAVFFSMRFIHCTNQKKYIQDVAGEMLYVNDDRRNRCMEAMDEVLDERYHGIAVFGSSELGNYRNANAFPQDLYRNGKSDFNMILIGRGYMQSLHHAINVGAMEESIQNRKVALILSPQWFTEAGSESSTYVSRFSEQMYVRMMENSHISKETKQAVTNRLEALLADDEIQWKRLKRYYDKNPGILFSVTERIGQNLYFRFMEDKRMYDVVHMADEMGLSGKPDMSEEAAISGSVERTEKAADQDFVDASAIDYKELRKEAVSYAESITTNNEFGVYDEYFDTYMRDRLEESRESAKESSYAVSPEYGDFKLFLDVCKETGIRPLIISIPVNGRWYDYIGFPKSERETYYQNIRDICNRYEVQLADFSDKEYELYFLKDIMHLGAKGWAYVDEAVYQYYTEDLEK